MCCSCNWSCVVVDVCVTVAPLVVAMGWLMNVLVGHGMWDVDVDDVDVDMDVDVRVQQV